MISVFQKNKKSITTIMLAGIAVVLMISFGLDARSGIGRAQGGGDAIKVEGETITVQAYANRLNRLTVVYRQQFGENFSSVRNFLNLEQRTVDGLIQEVLLDRFTEKLRLAVGPQQLEQKIREFPYFQKVALTKDSYERFLQAQQISPRGFEEDLRRNLKVEQLEKILADLSQPSTRELRAGVRAQNTKFDFEYVSFPVSSFAAKVAAPTEEKLKEIYAANAEPYRKPKAVRYAYVPFPAAESVAQVSVTEDDLRELYVRNERELTEPKQVLLRKIVLNRPKKEKGELEKLVTGDGAASSGSVTELDKAKKEAIETMLKRIDGGESFAEVAKAGSEDASTKEKGGELGWVPLTAIEKEFRDEVDSLEKGKVTEVLSNADFYVLYQVEDLKEPVLKPFETVRTQLESDFRASVAPEYARVEAENFLRSLREEANGKSPDLQTFAQKKGKTASVTEKLLSSGEDPANLGGFTAKVLPIPSGESEVVRVGEVDYVVTVLEVKDSYIPELATVRDKVEAAYRQQEAKKLAKEAAEAALKKIQARDEKADGHTILESVSKEFGGQIKTVSAVTRQSPGADELLSVSSVRDEAFGLLPEQYGKSIAEGVESFYVYRLSKVTVPTDKEIEAGLAEFRKVEQDKVKARMFGFLIETLKASSQIWVNPDLLKRGDVEELVL